MSIDIRGGREKIHELIKKTEKQIEQYEHLNKKQANNPPVGLVTPKSDPDTGEKKTYEYDPHLDPQLRWAGKAEHTSFEYRQLACMFMSVLTRKPLLTR